MKKLIAAAVATSVSAIAFADVSITGNANYEYFHKEDSGINTNYADTEINLSVKGKTGDTSVVANFEVTNHGSTAGSNNSLDVEDTYLTTKVGDVSIKAGNFASGTTALGGEIDQGSRATNKMSATTKIGGATIGYHVASASATDDVYNTDGAAITASMNIGGVQLDVKEQSDSYTLIGAKGSVAGINYRVENWDSDTANSDVLFYEVGGKLGAVDVSYAAIDADTTGLVTEGDSSIFAQEMATDSNSTGKTGVDGVTQVTLGTTVDGTALKLRVGELRGAASYKDAGFSRVEASRTLASGAKLTVSYDDYEDTGVTTGAMSDTQLLEIDLSINF
jgi:hypothetical protein